MNQSGQNQKSDRYQPTSREEKEFDEKIIEIKRVSKKTKGGNRISFTGLVVLGDHKGRAGIGFGKAPDVLATIKKGVRKAKKNLVSIDLIDNGTIAHQVTAKHGAAIVMLKPAPDGTGVIAGGPVRAVVEAFGVRNIVTKCLGSNNKAANVHATFAALAQLKRIVTKTAEKLIDKTQENKPEIIADKKPVKVKNMVKKAVNKKTGISKKK